MGVFDYVRYEANCPHCGKRLTAFQPWGCPYCGRRFRHVEDAIVHSDRCRRSPANDKLTGGNDRQKDTHE